MSYLELFYHSLLGTSSWVWQLVTFRVPWFHNYFYGLIVISLVVWGLEILFPWRKNQAVTRKDFWLDGFYMFFNFFLFSIAINGFYVVIESICNSYFSLRMSSLWLLDLSDMPIWMGLVVFFLLSDFVQWLTHVMMHKFPLLWKFHRVHHSVKEMGFAAHLRYHWMENVVYKPLKTIVVMIVGGFEPSQAFIIHFFAIIIGHLNHANLKINYGPLKYLFNNPIMHLWHHAKVLPVSRQDGVNFGISLSLWDYLFKTNYIPRIDGEIELGFDGDESFPTSFVDQFTSGFVKENNK